MRDLTLELVDETGKLRSFNDYKKATAAVNDQFNKTWLKTEYNQAVGASTMASRWVEFIKHADKMPFLQYQTVGDRRVRDEHKLLDGIIRKIDDDFWKTHFPPNGWGCRCDVNQLPGNAKETDTDNIPGINIPGMFRTNLAQSGLIYPTGHPYYDGVPAKDLQDAIYYLPPSALYHQVYNSKAKVFLHLLHGLRESAQNVATAKLLADLGLNVKLLPVLEGANDTIREFVYGTKNFVSNKNPDAIINGMLVDFKQPKNSKSTSIHKAISSGNKQVDWTIIHLAEKMDEAEIKRAVKGQMKQAIYTDQVWVINKSGVPLKYTRKDLGLPKKAKRPTR